MLWQHTLRMWLNSLESWLWHWPLGATLWQTAHKQGELFPASHGRWAISHWGCDAKPKLSSTAGVLRIARKSYLGTVCRAKLICKVYLANRDNHTFEKMRLSVHNNMSSKRGMIYQICCSLWIVHWSLAKGQIPQKFISQYISAVTGTQYWGIIQSVEDKWEIIKYINSSLQRLWN